MDASFLTFPKKYGIIYIGEKYRSGEMAAKKPQVKCPGCTLTFYREDEPHIFVKNRYWHTVCYNEAQAKIEQSQGAIKELESYLCDLFDMDFVSPRIRNQIKTMVDKYNYSYSGILGSLKYWFEIKENSLEKANNGIGIVPYIYDDARKYYETVFYAHQQNKGIDEIDIETITIRISSPERRVKSQKTVDLEFLEER